MKLTTMTSTRPYFVRALYEWILDNQCTPYLLVNANYPAVQVPNEHVKDGRIILNLSPSAIRGLVMDNERVEFSARFGGVPRSLYLPIGAVLAVYAKENGRGMFFDENEFPIPETAAPTAPALAPALAPAAVLAQAPALAPTAAPAVSDTKAGKEDASAGDSSADGASPANPSQKNSPPDDKGGGGGGKKRPSLKVVK